MNLIEIFRLNNFHWRNIRCLVMNMIMLLRAGLLSEEQCKARDVRRKARAVRQAREEPHPTPDSNTPSAPVEKKGLQLLHNY